MSGNFFFQQPISRILFYYDFKKLGISKEFFINYELNFEKGS